MFDKIKGERLRFLRYIFCALLFVTAAVADTININWINGGETYAQTTCEIGGDIILPPPPTKRGHTFIGWINKRYIPVLPNNINKYPKVLNGWKVRVLDGTENFAHHGSTGYCTTFIGLSILPNNVGSGPYMCSHFLYDSTGVEYMGLNKFSPRVEGRVDFCIGQPDGSTTLAEFRTYLIDQYVNGTPVTILYSTTTPDDSVWIAVQDTGVDGTQTDVYGYYNKMTSMFVKVYGMTGILLYD